MYRAKEEIGNFKKGDLIPDELGDVWSKMYKESPVEKLKETELVPEVAKEEAKEKACAWHDDYLNQNAKTVINSIKNDDLEDKDIKKLITLEERGNNRSSVINALKTKRLA